MLTVRKEQLKQMATAQHGKKMIQPCANMRTWIEIRLVDEDGHPVKQARYRLRLPDESIMEGTLDDDGLARVDNIIPGTCTVEFPEIDHGEWRPA